MKSYLLISLSDFPRLLFGKSPEERFRSLEKYLERNFIPFDCKGERMYIFPKDEFEARMIGTDFRFRSLPYFINGRETELSLIKVKPVRQPKLKKVEEKDEEDTVIVSLKDLKQSVRVEKTEAKTLVKTLMARKILTNKELKKGVKDGIFHPVVV